MSKSKPFEINWLGAAGSALGAVSSAVLLSTLGAVGTIFGAALGSVVITVGGSIYTQSLQKTSALVVGTVPGARSSSPKGRAPSGGNRGADPAPEVSPAPGRPPKKPWGQVFRDLPWKRIAGVAGGVFVAAMAIISTFELSTGQPVSAHTGGSSETRTGTTFSGLNPASDESEKPQESEVEAPGEDAQQEDAQPQEEEKPVQDDPPQEKPDDQTPVEERQADPAPVPEAPAENQQSDE